MGNKNQLQDLEIIKLKTEVKAEIQALRDVLKDFISNHFAHLRDKVDKIFFIVITSLVAFIVALIGILVKLLFF